MSYIIVHVKLRVDDAELEGLLTGHSKDIGKTVGPGVADAITGIGLPMAVFSTKWPACLQWPLGLFGIGFCIYGIHEAAMALHHPYGYDRLLEDIRNMDRTEKRSSIIAVRDTAKGTNRFLLYWDVRWECDFFPNHDTSGSVPMEKPELQEWLSNKYGIPKSSFRLKYLREMSNSKPSLSHHGEMRDYVYRLWVADVVDMPQAWESETFDIGGLRCRWATIADMEADSRIMEVNEDVVDMVKGFVA